MWVALTGTLLTICLSIYHISKDFDSIWVDRGFGALVAFSFVLVGSVVTKRYIDWKCRPSTALGFLDHLRIWQKYQKRWNRLLVLMDEETRHVGTSVRKATPQLAAANKAGNYIRAGRIASRLAVKISKSARHSNKYCAEFKQYTDSFVKGIEGQINFAVQCGESPEVSFIDSLRRGVESAREGYVSYRQSIQTVDGITQELNTANAELLASVDNFIRVLDDIIGFCSRIRPT